VFGPSEIPQPMDPQILEIGIHRKAIDDKLVSRLRKKSLTPISNIAEPGTAINSLADVVAFVL
jgi:hypothetical protein